MRRTSFWIVALAFTSPALADEPPPRPIAAWASGPLEARVTFDRAVPESAVKALVGTRIVFGDDVKAGDRYVERKPGDRPSGAESRGSLRIAAARIEGETLVLATDPHSRDTTYALRLPAPIDADVTYRLRGVEFAWSLTKDGATRTAVGVWPALDSSSLQRDFDRIAWISRQSRQPSRLILKTLLALPRGKVTLIGRSSVPSEWEVGGESVKSKRSGNEETLEATVEVEADVVDLTWTLEIHGSKVPAFSATYRAGDDPTVRPFATEGLVLTWAPPRTAESAAAPVPPALLSGGDAAKGAVVFKSEQAKCGTCHRVRGVGGEVGPDLSELVHRDRAWIYRQINEPSVVIHPDYVPYVVQAKDGRVLAGIVRAEGADAIRVVDTEARAHVLKKDEIEELKPSATSIMPVGLLGALGEEGVRDLLAFLTSPAAAK